MIVLRTGWKIVPSRDLVQYVHYFHALEILLTDCCVQIGKFSSCLLFGFLAKAPACWLPRIVSIFRGWVEFLTEREGGGGGSRKYCYLDGTNLVRDRACVLPGWYDSGSYERARSCLAILPPGCESSEKLRLHVIMCCSLNNLFMHLFL